VRNGNYAAVYSVTLENEKSANDTLIRFEANYPGVTNQENVNDILRTLKQKQKKAADQLAVPEDENTGEE